MAPPMMSTAPKSCRGVMDSCSSSAEIRRCAFALSCSCLCASLFFFCIFFHVNTRPRTAQVRGPDFEIGFAFRAVADQKADSKEGTSRRRGKKSGGGLCRGSDVTEPRHSLPLPFESHGSKAKPRHPPKKGASGLWKITLIMIPNAPHVSRGVHLVSPGVHFSKVGCISTNWNLSL